MPKRAPIGWFLEGANASAAGSRARCRARSSATARPPGLTAGGLFGLLLRSHRFQPVNTAALSRSGIASRPGEGSAQNLRESFLCVKRRSAHRREPGAASLMRNSLSAMVSSSLRRSFDCCGLSEPSVETRFAESGVFAGE
jgi:hypothetical protein